MLTKQFFTAGKAVFTVANPEGKHYTYKIRKSKDGEKFFVSLLTGPQNTSDYTYMGVLENGSIRLTMASTYKEDSLPVKVVRWALSLVWRDMPFPNGYSLHHEGKCCRCGRPLTVPESIESGIGRKCQKMLSNK